MVTALVLGAGLFYTNAANREQLNVVEQGQITSRLTQAVEQLGSTEFEVRLGAIYALERIMRDSVVDQPSIVEILTAYVRQRVPVVGGAPSSRGASPSQRPTSTSTSAPLTALAPDTKAALTVLGRRQESHDRRGALPDLSNLNLSRTDLRRMDLSHLDLSDTDLADADLTGADLTGARLRDASLGAATFDFATLTGAMLAGADLHDAQLTAADLTRAELIDANLQGANLNDANITGGDLTNAALDDADLTYANLAGARLTGANLAGADLSNTTGVTANALHCAHVDETTTMPTGMNLTNTSSASCA
jgi:uncharacterized protein YjbI with pentapeptide repeats